MKDVNYRLLFQLLSTLQEGEKIVSQIPHMARNQIYHYTKRLSAAGIIEIRMVEGPSGQTVQSYKLTERGWTLATLGRRVLEFGL